MSSPRVLIGETARWAVVVAVAFLALHLPKLAERYEPNTWLFRDNAFYFMTTTTLAEHGRLEQRAYQPESWYVRDLQWNRNLDDGWSNVSLGRNQGWYPKHPIILPVLAVAFYWLLGIIGTLVLNVLLNLTFVLLVFLISRRVARPPMAAAAAIIVAAMPFVREMSYSFSNDLLSAVLLLGAIEGALAGWLGVAGILAGLSIWSRVTNAAVLPALVVIAASSGGWLAVRRAVLFALIPLSVFAVFNTYLFGAPWVTSYQSVIVRENGAMRTASHSRLFNQDFFKGLDALLFAPVSRDVNAERQGVFRVYPLLWPGLAGLLVLLYRHRWLAIGLLLCCVLPAVVYAKYDMVRPHFFYPAFGLAGVGLAGIGGLFLPKKPDAIEKTWSIPRWPLWATLAGGLVVAAVSHAATRVDTLLLSTQVHDAKVWLDDIPCDYWNIQVERWECSHFDNGGAMMTGRLLKPEPVDGVPRAGLWMQPSPTRRAKRMVFSHLDAKSVNIEFALADASRPGTVELEILARGQPPVTLELSRRGQVEQRHIDIGPGEGDALELRVRSSAPDAKHVIVEGHLH